jgi:hypothetical protein
VLLQIESMEVGEKAYGTLGKSSSAGLFVRKDLPGLGIKRRAPRMQRKETMDEGKDRSRDPLQKEKEPRNAWNSRKDT